MTASPNQGSARTSFVGTQAKAPARCSLSTPLGRIRSSSGRLEDSKRPTSGRIGERGRKDTVKRGGGGGRILSDLASGRNQRSPRQAAESDTAPGAYEQEVAGSSRHRPITGYFPGRRPHESTSAVPRPSPIARVAATPPYKSVSRRSSTMTATDLRIIRAGVSATATIIRESPSAIPKTTDSSIEAVRH